MPSLLQGVQGFAGASGVGIMCLAALFFGASVFATNLPLVADFVVASKTWSGITTIPTLVVAYVVGLLAIALVERPGSGDARGLASLQGLAAQRYAQLEQEAEVLSGSVVGFLLLAAAAFLNVRAYPGWTRTLSICGAAFVVMAFGAWRTSRLKHRASAQIASGASDRSGSLSSMEDVAAGDVE